MKYVKYLKYVLRHKWFVMVECFKCGLIWRGVMHDLSKFLPDEFIPYANFFYGEKPSTIRDKTGYYKPTDTGDKAFDFAWLLHQKRNRHHWQWWILPEDEGGIKVLPIEEPYLTEMICDWIGAGKAQGHFSPKEDKLLETRNWWKANNHKMQLCQKTREYLIEKFKVAEPTKEVPDIRPILEKLISKVCNMSEFVIDRNYNPRADIDQAIQEISTIKSNIDIKDILRIIYDNLILEDLSRDSISKSILETIVKKIEQEISALCRKENV